MSAILAAAVPYLVQYGIPALALGLGHLSGWLHHKHTAAKAAAVVSSQGGK
jgi:hypothetical protein